MADEKEPLDLTAYIALGVLLKVEDQEGNVILLQACGAVARKTGDAFEEGADEMSGGNVAMRFQEFLAA